MALGDLNDLVNGSSYISTGSGNTIVVQNGNNRAANNSGCLPCSDETVCTIGASNGSRLDLSKIRSSSNKVRFNVDTRESEGAGTDQNMIFFTPLYAGTWCSDFPSLCEYFGDYPVGGDSGEGSDGSLINGKEAQGVMAQFNVSGLNGGATIAKITIQYNASLYPQLDGMTITGAFLPPDPSDSVEADVIYSPLCDSCSTSGSGNFTTHAYQATLPVSGRQLVAIFIPGATGGAVFTADLCFATNGFPNNEQTTWAEQE